MMEGNIMEARCSESSQLAQRRRSELRWISFGISFAAH